MDFEKIEQAYTYLLENVQVIQSDLATNFYDALVEQNSIYLDGETELEQVKENNQALKRLALRKEEWLKTYQFLLMKAGQTEPLQANHQFTPDAIALLLVFIVEELFKEEEITILEMGSGMGILGATFLTSLDKKVDYLGMEVDDLLIDLAASMADVIGLTGLALSKEMPFVHKCSKKAMWSSATYLSAIIPDDAVCSAPSSCF